jgi:hypothetical protein
VHTALLLKLADIANPQYQLMRDSVKAYKDKVEDEHHFLIECPIYNSVRDKFFTVFNRKFNETTELTINRLLNPSSSQDLNNI